MKHLVRLLSVIILLTLGTSPARADEMFDALRAAQALDIKCHNLTFFETRYLDYIVLMYGTYEGDRDNIRPVSKGNIEEHWQAIKQQVEAIPCDDDRANNYKNYVLTEILKHGLVVNSRASLQPGMSKAINLLVNYASQLYGEAWDTKLGELQEAAKTMNPNGSGYEMSVVARALLMQAELQDHGYTIQRIDQDKAYRLVPSGGEGPGFFMFHADRDYAQQNGFEQQDLSGAMLMTDEGQVIFMLIPEWEKQTAPAVAEATLLWRLAGSEGDENRRQDLAIQSQWERDDWRKEAMTVLLTNYAPCPGTQCFAANNAASGLLAKRNRNSELYLSMVAGAAPSERSAPGERLRVYPEDIQIYRQALVPVAPAAGSE